MAFDWQKRPVVFYVLILYRFECSWSTRIARVRQEQTKPSRAPAVSERRSNRFRRAHCFKIKTATNNILKRFKKSKEFVAFTDVGRREISSLCKSLIVEKNIQWRGEGAVAAKKTVGEMVSSRSITWTRSLSLSTVHLSVEAMALKIITSTRHISLYSTQ